jgi:hypothetical protein
MISTNVGCDARRCTLKLLRKYGGKRVLLVLMKLQNVMQVGYKATEGRGLPLPGQGLVHVDGARLCLRTAAIGGPTAHTGV